MCKDVNVRLSNNPILRAQTNYNALYVYRLHLHTDGEQHKFMYHKFIYSENNRYFEWREAIC